MANKDTVIEQLKSSLIQDATPAKGIAGAIDRFTDALKKAEYGQKLCKICQYEFNKYSMIQAAPRVWLCQGCYDKPDNLPWIKAKKELVKRKVEEKMAQDISMLEHGPGGFDGDEDDN